MIDRPASQPAAEPPESSSAPPGEGRSLDGESRGALADSGRDPAVERLPDMTTPAGTGVTAPEGVKPGAAEDAEPARPRRDSLLEVTTVVLVALFLALILKIYVAEAYEIRGQSMQPTFVDGERVMVQKCFYALERGDVIIFASKTDAGKDLIKRVVGLPGDRISVKPNGEVIVNEKPLEEGYIRRCNFPKAAYGPFTVPENTYFVLGDNRPQSQDSRNFREIDLESIKGKVMLRWWPLDRIETF